MKTGQKVWTVVFVGYMILIAATLVAFCFKGYYGDWLFKGISMTFNGMIEGEIAAMKEFISSGIAKVEVVGLIIMLGTYVTLFTEEN